MARITETELQKRLKALEREGITSQQLITKVGEGVYEWVDEYTYIAYASSISNVSATGVIPDQSDATGFSFRAISDGGVTLNWLGYWTSKSIDQSGDPTDYIWTDLSTAFPASSIESYYTESDKMLTDVGNPETPVSGVTWVSFTGSIPSSAWWVATRYTINDVKTAWRVVPVKVKKSSLGLIHGTISGRNRPTMNDSQWKTDTISIISAFTGEVYSTISEMGFGTAISITYDDGKLHGMLKDVSGTPTWVTTPTFIDGELLLSETVIADKIAANAITTVKLNADAITADKIAAGTITADEIGANAITSAKVNADAITVDKIDLNGTLSVTANSGAIRWGKDDGDDITNSGLFIGRNSSGSPRFVIGSNSSFIYYNGATGVVSAVGVSESATTGEEENFYTDTSTTHIFTISPLLDEINIQMVGGGAGGCKESPVDGYSPGAPATAGGASTVVVKQSNGSTRATYTAAGGAVQSGCSGGGNGGSFVNGIAGTSFAHPGGGAHASFAGTGGAGGVYGGAGPGAGGTGAGGGGRAKGTGSGESGDGGGAGTFYTITLTTSGGTFASTDHLEITVGGAGQGRITTRDGSAGNGGAGRVRVKGELA